MTSATPDLHDFAGRLVLVGAGKMGSALLEGWLRFGLDPKHIAVLEPQPSPQIAALTTHGLVLNPPLRALTDIAAVVTVVAIVVILIVWVLLRISKVVIERRKLVPAAIRNRYGEHL